MFSSLGRGVIKHKEGFNSSSVSCCSLQQMSTDLQVFKSVWKVQARWSPLTNSWDERNKAIQSFRASCQGVDSVHWWMELQTCTEVQLPDISPGSCVLANEWAVLVERYLSSFSIFHQTVIAICSLHNCFHRWLASLNPSFLLSTIMNIWENNIYFVTARILKKCADFIASYWPHNMYWIHVRTCEEMAESRHELSYNLFKKKMKRKRFILV